MSPAVLVAERELGRAQQCSMDKESIIQLNGAGAHRQHVRAQPEHGSTALGAPATLNPRS